MRGVEMGFRGEPRGLLTRISRYVTTLRPAFFRGSASGGPRERRFVVRAHRLFRRLRELVVGTPPEPLCEAIPSNRRSA